MAIGTNSNAPHITDKPGEFGRCRPHITAPPGIPVTDDFKNDPFRVGKRVRVRAVDDLVLCVRSDHVQALAADNCIRGCRRCLVLRHCNRINIYLLRLGNRPEKMRVSVHRFTVLGLLSFVDLVRRLPSSKMRPPIPARVTPACNQSPDQRLSLMLFWLRFSMHPEPLNPEPLNP